MSQLVRPLPAILFAAALAWGCYPHAGQPTDTDEQRWKQLAEQACQRGDRPAYEAFAARLDDQDSLRCNDRPKADDSTSGEHN